MKNIGGQIFPEEVLRGHISQETIALDGQGGTETDIFPAVSDSFQDLCLVGGTNSSDVAINVSLRDADGGSVRLTLPFPASTTKLWIFYVPFKQTEANNKWTATRPNDGAGTVTLYVQRVRKGV